MRDDDDHVKWGLRKHPWDCVLSGDDGVPKYDCVHLNKENDPPSCGFFHREIYKATLVSPTKREKNPRREWICKSLHPRGDDAKLFPKPYSPENKKASNEP